MATDDDQRETEGAARKRAAPTIDLDPSDVTDTTPKGEVNAESEAERTSEDVHADHAQVGGGQSDTTSGESAQSASSEPSPAGAAPSWRVVLPAALSAAVVALLVSGLWNALWPNNSDPDIPPAQTSTIEGLSTRVAQLESKPTPVPVTVDTSALTKRLDALDQAVADIRTDMTALREQMQALAAKTAEAVEAKVEPKAEPKAESAAEAKDEAKAAPAPDISGLEERLAKLEQQAVAASAEAATKLVAAPPPPPPDDTALRRALAATALDQTVRQGLPYAAMLAAATRLGGEASVLAPLEPFAATGVPTAEALCRELLMQLPRLAAAPKSAPAASGWVERLGDSASRLVKVTRVDDNGTDRAALLSRATTAANRNDLKQASEIVAQLPEPDRTALQGWIGKVQARGTALAASRAFAETATAALPPSPH